MTANRPRLRILLLSSVEHQSGSALRFRGIAGALARRGHDVHLLEPFARDENPETPPGVTRHPCPRLPGSPESQALLWLVHGVWAVLGSRPRIVYALKALPNVWCPLRLAWLMGARTALDVDDLDFAYYPRGIRRSLIQWIFHHAVRSADDVTVHNDALRELVLRLRRSKSAPLFVDQGIDVVRFAQSSTNSQLRERLQLGEGPVILYAGHLGPASNLASLLPALARVPHRYPRARLLVVGSGRDQRDLEAAARRHLPEGFTVFAGSVPHREVPGYFRLASIAVNYLDDNEANRHRSSIKVREALAAGLPVVTTRTPDTSRFSEFVRLVEPGPPEAFVDALLAELERGDRSRADAGRRHLLDSGTFDVAVRDLAEMWERLEKV
jgi:glycosyltransferase involved in cell wall biosynthesis